MTIEHKVKMMILSNYRSIAAFCEENDIKYTTLMSALKNGLDGASVGLVMKVAKALDTDVESLLNEKDDAEFNDIQIAANNGFDLDDLSESDQEEIRNFIRFKRGQKNEPTDSSD